MADATQCPECRSYKVIDQKRRYVWGGIALMGLSLPWVWLIFPVVFVLAGLAVAIGGLVMSRAKRFRCRSCNFQFPVPAP